MNLWPDGVVLLVMLVGVVGLVLPVLPGLLLMWSAVLVWVLADGGGAIRWLAFGLATALVAVGTLAAAVLSSRRATAAGAPWWVLIPALAGMIIGFFVIPVFGIVLGGLAGIWLAELARVHEARTAWRTTWAVVQGYGVGTAIQLATGIATFLVWSVAVLVTQS